jgi:hypothetical protein
VRAAPLSPGGGNSTKEYGVGPYDPFGSAWGVSSCDFISREKFNESYDAWVAAGLYFDNNTDSGNHSYDYIYSALFISTTTLNLIASTLTLVCGGRRVGPDLWAELQMLEARGAEVCVANVLLMCC